MDLALELVIKIFFAMALGFILYKIKMLNTEVNVALSRLLVEVVVVCMVFAPHPARPSASTSASARARSFVVFFIGGISRKKFVFQRDF